MVFEFVLYGICVNVIVLVFVDMLVLCVFIVCSVDLEVVVCIN